MNISWEMKVWVDPNPKRDGSFVYYEAVVGTKRCWITLNGKDKRSSCTVICEVWYDDDWRTDDLRPAETFRWFQNAKKYAENWLLDKPQNPMLKW